MRYTILFFTLLFSFSLFAADKAKTVSLNITGMTCESCAGTVEKALKKVNGVKEVTVDLKNKKATVILASTGTSSSLIKAVSDAGFSANERKSTAKTEMKKQMKSESEGSCSEECDQDAKPVKAKKTDPKKPYDGSFED